MLAFASILGVADHWYEGDLAANLASVERGLQVADEFGYPMYRVIGPLWATAALTARGPAPKVLEQLCGLLGKLPAENRCIQMPALSNSARDRIRTDRGDRKGSKLRCFG